MSFVVNEKHRIFIALGSNLGDRQANLQAALGAMRPTLKILAQSPVYETAPWGVADQPDFLNQVVQAETSLPPEDLLDFLKSIEAGQGRKPGVRYGPRPIDLDILLYDSLVLDTPRLTIPHPRLSERAFVLYPLADLEPDLRHPLSGQTVARLRDALGAQVIRRLTG